MVTRSARRHSAPAALPWPRRSECDPLADRTVIHLGLDGEFAGLSSSGGPLERMLVDGRSQRQVAKEFGISRVTVRKYVEGAEPVRREAGPRRANVGSGVLLNRRPLDNS